MKLLLHGHQHFFDAELVTAAPLALATFWIWSRTAWAAKRRTTRKAVFSARPAGLAKLWLWQQIHGRGRTWSSRPGDSSSTPPPPILEIFKYGAVGRFDRLWGQRNGCEAKPSKGAKWSTAFAKRQALLSKSSFSFAVGEWLAGHSMLCMATG